LATAQNIKRNSDTVVDAITAPDIGALPDRSVNEALQRASGVVISHFAAPTDSTHFWRVWHRGNRQYAKGHVPAGRAGTGSLFRQPNLAVFSTMR
jgi:hypothetical protein